MDDGSLTCDSVRPVVSVLKTGSGVVGLPCRDPYRRVDTMERRSGNLTNETSSRTDLTDSRNRR